MAKILGPSRGAQSGGNGPYPFRGRPGRRTGDQSFQPERREGGAGRRPAGRRTGPARQHAPAAGN